MTIACQMQIHIGRSCDVVAEEYLGNRNQNGALCVHFICSCIFLQYKCGFVFGPFICWFVVVFNDRCMSAITIRKQGSAHLKHSGIYKYAFYRIH